MFIRNMYLMTIYFINITITLQDLIKGIKNSNFSKITNMPLHNEDYKLDSNIRSTNSQPSSKKSENLEIQISFLIGKLN